jgi:dolichyl-phosphate-mannose-protein mannosyltransferase
MAMQAFNKLTLRSIWPWIGLCGILGIAFGTRFWGLNRFNALVFDEIYYAKYAHNYLNRVPFFDAHPPLGKYLISVGLWLSHFLPFSTTPTSSLEGSTYAPWSFRWFNALTGSLISPIVVGIAYQLSGRWRFALIAGLFTALDGLLLVESRYALINIYLVFWGLLGQLLFLFSLCQGKAYWRWFWLAFAGICFGASISVKWNGLAFILGLLVFWLAVQLFNYISPARSPDPSAPHSQPAAIFQATAQLRLPTLAIALAVIPLLVYTLIWIPHLEINQISLRWVHEQIFDYHTRMKDGPTVHPYCSRWYTWPLLLRPMSYFYQTTRSITDPLPPANPPIPAAEGTVVYDVHAMGNPFLWWYAAIALMILVAQWFGAISRGHKVLTSSLRKFPTFYVPSLFILTNYVAGFLPWAAVSRCTFIYLYMGTSVYSFLAIAYWTDQWTSARSLRWRCLGWLVMGTIAIAFLYWLPIYLGLPLTTSGFSKRMWFNSWI